jgi:hypothetical protein
MTLLTVKNCKDAAQRWVLIIFAIRVSGIDQTSHKIEDRDRRKHHFHHWWKAFVVMVSKASAHDKIVNGKTSKHPSIIDSIFKCYVPEPRRYKCRNQKGIKKDPTRRLRMQPPLKTEMLSLSTRLTFIPRQGGHFASPPHAPACAHGQPCSSHAWHPSPPEGQSRGPSQPWHGECALRGHACA